MSQKLGVKLISNENPKITAWEPGFFYNYVFICEQVYINNGNGLCRLKVYDNNENHIIIEKNGWKIDPIVKSPFNWRGSSIEPTITDPTGISREIYKGGYSATIFKGLSYAKDINAIFTLLDEYSGFSNWFEADFEKMKSEKDDEIKSLKETIANLNDTISTLREKV